MVERLLAGRQQLEQLLVTDELTGISNRRHLEATLKSEIRRSRRSQRSFALLMADVDRFKEFNDNHGHLAGDNALKSVAQVLRKTMRNEDYVARYGGEEFLAVLPDTDLSGGVKAAERVRERLAKIGVAVGKQFVTLTVSVGVAEFPTDGDSPESLIAAADAALYQAKRRGRDRVVSAGSRRGTTAAMATRTTKSTGSKTTNPKKSTNSKRTNSKNSKRTNSTDSISTNSRTTKPKNVKPRATKPKATKAKTTKPKATKAKTTKRIKVAS
jgi:diguanylate cyclase (GGDEF)-like protein